MQSTSLGRGAETKSIGFRCVGAFLPSRTSVGAGAQGPAEITDFIIQFRETMFKTRAMTKSRSRLSVVSPLSSLSIRMRILGAKPADTPTPVFGLDVARGPAGAGSSARSGSDARASARGGSRWRRTRRATAGCLSPGCTSRCRSLGERAAQPAGLDGVADHAQADQEQQPSPGDSRIARECPDQAHRRQVGRRLGQERRARPSGGGSCTSANGGSRTT